jgi:peptidyl-prolyl cis-trans isomerase SurA
MPGKRIAFAFLGLLPVYMAFAQVQSPKEIHIAEKIIAVVADRIILSSEIENSINDWTRLGMSIPANANCLFTEQAIISKLLMLQAIKDSLPVMDEEVDAEFDRRIKYYSKQTGNEMDDNAITDLKKSGRESLKESMLAGAMRQKITDAVKITPSEVKDFFEKIPKDSLPFIEPQMEIGQIIIYPLASKDLEQYTINELNNYKRQVENKTVSFCRVAKLSDEQGACSEHEINRNSPDWDPAFLSAAFRLKNDEISVPVKCRFGYYLVQMVARKGDNATVRYIFRSPAVTETEIGQARAALNAIRSDIMERKIGFNEAAFRYSDDKMVKTTGPFLLNTEGSTYLSPDQVDKELIDIVGKMNVGEISLPLLFINEQNQKAIRIIFLKYRSERHRMNIREDYTGVSRMALEAKKERTLERWISSKTPDYYIMLDDAMLAQCPQMRKYASSSNGKR